MSTLISALPVDRWIEYDIALRTDSGDVWLSEEMPNLIYPGEARMRFVIKTRMDELLFGSCRKPHHDSGAGLVLVDELLGQVRGTGADPTAQSASLLITGDQVYLDDVAGPMLAAIHQVIERLGLPSEGLRGAVIDDSAALYGHPDTYFRREICSLRVLIFSARRSRWMCARDASSRSALSSWPR